MRKDSMDSNRVEQNHEHLPPPPKQQQQQQQQNYSPLMHVICQRELFGWQALDHWRPERSLLPPTGTRLRHWQSS